LTETDYFFAFREYLLLNLVDLRAIVELKGIFVFKNGKIDE
jgi:hypothetical protein